MVYHLGQRYLYHTDGYAAIEVIFRGGYDSYRGLVYEPLSMQEFVVLYTDLYEINVSNTTIGD